MVSALVRWGRSEETSSSFSELQNTCISAVTPGSKRSHPDVVVLWMPVRRWGNLWTHVHSISLELGRNRCTAAAVPLLPRVEWWSWDSCQGPGPSSLTWYSLIRRWWNSLGKGVIAFSNCLWIICNVWQRLLGKGTKRLWIWKCSQLTG